MRRLPDFDEKFGALRDETYQEGNVLRYVGVVDPVNGIVKASLEKSGPDLRGNRFAHAYSQISLNSPIRRLVERLR